MTPTDEARAALWDWRDMTTDPPDGFGERLDALIAAVRAEEGARYRCDFDCRECDSATGRADGLDVATWNDALDHALQAIGKVPSVSLFHDGNVALMRSAVIHAVFMQRRLAKDAER